MQYVIDMRKIVSTISTLASCMFFTSAASAQYAGDNANAPSQSSAEAPTITIRIERPRPKVSRSWYGWQTMLALLPANALMLASQADGVGDAGPALFFTGLGMHLFSGPIVHTANGQYGKGMASLLLNVGVPTMGIVIGSATKKEGAMTAYGSAGMVIAQIIDTAAFSWKRKPAHTTGMLDRFMPASISITPRVDRTTQGFSFVSQF